MMQQKAGITHYNMQCLQGNVFFTDSKGIPTLRCNIRAQQENTYRLAGEMIATMTAQGGPLPQLFDAGAVRYMATGCLGIIQKNAPYYSRSVESGLFCCLETAFIFLLLDKLFWYAFDSTARTQRSSDQHSINLVTFIAEALCWSLSSGHWMSACCQRLTKTIIILLPDHCTSLSKRPNFAVVVSPNSDISACPKIVWIVIAGGITS